MADVNSAQQMLGTPTQTDSEIPLEHMDYDYISKCTNIKELEKIFKILKSGKEGYYPDLVDFCEKRLVDIAPKSKALRKEVRPANEFDLGKEEWNKITNDVKDWANDISKQSESDLSEKPGEEKLPPVRNRGSINTQGKKNDSSKEDWGKPSAERIKGSDFSRWDKYDAEAEEAKVDEKAKEKNLKAEAERLAKSRSAGDRDAINTSGMSDSDRELVANREKDKGNEAFRASDYKEAVHYYSRSLSVVPSAPAYNNRSLAQIKLGEYEGAVKDCTKVLELEPSNIKALLRRGTARKSLKYYDQALSDLQAVLQVEPNNKQALDMVNDVMTKMEKEKTQMEEELKKKRKTAGSSQQLPNGETNQKPGGRRLVIQEVDEDDDEDSGEEDEMEKKKSDKENASKKASNGEIGKVQGQKMEGEGAENGRSETDGCISSKQAASKSPSSSPLGGVSSTSLSTQGSSGGNGNQQQVAKEVQTPPTPTPAPPPPKPAPPLPDAVVFLKDEGNDLFKKGQYGEAMGKYSRAISKLLKDKDIYPVGLSTLYSNRASCNLKSGHSKDCIEDCKAALELNPSNVKTYLKRAQAYEILERYGHAYVDFKTAMNHDIYNTNAQNGASRMSAILKNEHGGQWRDRLPSQPISPSILWPVYTTADTSQSSSTTTTTNSTSRPATAAPRVLAETSQQAQPSAVQATPSSSQPTPSPQAPPTSKEGVTGKHPSSSSTSSTSSSSSSTRNAPAAPSGQEKSKVLTKEERFQEYKAQGNELVKKGEYSQAIGCYTRSIEVDPIQAVSYSNRALCYLKLNLPEDAIADCNEALKRDPNGIKALYRRAQARKMLAMYSESARDLTELLKIEPTNAPAKKELDIVKDAWRKDLREKQSKAVTKESPQATQEEGNKKKKKAGNRIQIQEVYESSEEEDETKGKSNNIPTSNAATSHPANLSEHRPEATSSPAGERGVTNMGTKENKDNKDNKKKDKSAKGGKENKLSSASTTSNGVPASKKMTAYEFMQEWTSLKKKKNLDGYAALLKQVQPNDIPKVLSNKLDGDMLGKILSASANHLVEDDPQFTFQLLNKLRCVDRFKTMTMFLTKRDKDNMQRCLNRISSKPDLCKEEDLKKLKKAYAL